MYIAAAGKRRCLESEIEDGGGGASTSSTNPELQSGQSMDSGFKALRKRLHLWHQYVEDMEINAIFFLNCRENKKCMNPNLDRS